MLERTNTFLAANPVLVLALVVWLGSLLGAIRIGGFQLGIAAVLFSGLAVGALSPDLALPDVVSSLGLVLFVYSIGIHAGPEFPKLFKKRGLRDSALVCGVLTFSALLVFFLGRLLGFSAPQIAGLYCGSLTSTPALAAVREFLGDGTRALGHSAEQLAALTNQPVVAYSIAYPFGVIGVILAFQLMRWWWRIEMPLPEGGAKIEARSFTVSNRKISGKAITEIMTPHEGHNFIISRIHHQGRTALATPQSVLFEGDTVAAVGEEHALELARQILGSESSQQLQLDRTEFDYRRIFVSSKDAVGRPIADLNLMRRFGALIARVRREDTDLVPSPQMCLAFGDRVRVLTNRNNFDAVKEFFGDSIKGTAEADYGAIAAGLLLGILIGMLPISVPGGTTVSLGLAGGPLLVALILGNLQRTANFTWIMPVGTNFALRQTGLLLFLSGVGTRAGHQFALTLYEAGGSVLIGRLFVAGVLTTCLATAITLYIGFWKLKLPFDYLMGIMSGLQTQPGVLAFANSQSKSDAAEVAYTGVYPAATIAKIIIAQLLLLIGLDFTIN